MRINLNDFVSDSDTGKLALAMQLMKNNPGTVLHIEPGTYTVTTELARKTMEELLAGEYGEEPEKIMFNPEFAYSRGVDLDGQMNTVIDAYGVTLLVDGFMEPLCVRSCSNVSIRGLTIDHKRKPFSMAKVQKAEYTQKSSGTGYFTALFDEEYPMNPNIPILRTCFFTPYGNRFAYYKEYKITGARQLDGQLWRFDFEGLFYDVDGMELYVWHSFHSRPAIMLENSSDVELLDVTIHSQPGMGIVAHRCENMTLRRLRVVPSGKAHMSTNTDACHFTSCKGLVRVENCFFEGQGDDSLNIHTYYHTVKRTGEKSCVISLNAPTGTHSQTPDYPDVGDVLELTDADTLSVRACFTVVKREPGENGMESVLTLDRDLPQDCNGNLFANATRQPRLEFIGNVSHAHLARGVLVKVKNALIEGNTFIDVVGTAIYVAAESWWCEGVCTTESIEIRRNRISFCGRNNDIRQRDTAGICVTVDADKPSVKTHRSVTIEDNGIFCPDSPHGIYVSNTQELNMSRNTVSCLGEPIVLE